MNEAEWEQFSIIKSNEISTKVYHHVSERKIIFQPADISFSWANNVKLIYYCALCNLEGHFPITKIFISHAQFSKQ
jgi:hypothetical protein